MVGRNARDVPAKRHPISHERYEFALYTLCYFVFQHASICSMLHVLPCESGWEAAKAGRGLKGPAQQAAHGRIRFSIFSRSPGRRSLRANLLLVYESIKGIDKRGPACHGTPRTRVRRLVWYRDSSVWLLFGRSSSTRGVCSRLNRHTPATRARPLAAFGFVVPGHI